MKDGWGDKITAKPTYAADGVFIESIDSDTGESVVITLEPKKARKLARKINMAASRIEIAQRGR